MKLKELPYKVLIPVYNGENVVGDTIINLMKYCSRENILAINDGSTDKSAQVVLDLGIELLDMPVNGGKGLALEAGISKCAQENISWVISMDADGQHLASDLVKFLDFELNDDIGMIVGARNFKDKSMPKARVFSNTVSTAIVSSVANCKTFDSQCGYRAYNTALANKDCLPKEGRFEWESEVMIRASRAEFSISKVGIETIYNEDGPSHISHFRDTIRFLKMIVKYL